MTEIVGGKSGVGGFRPDPGRVYKPANGEHPDAHGKQQSVTCPHPGCTRTFVPPKGNVRFCERHRDKQSQQERWRLRHAEPAAKTPKSAPTRTPNTPPRQAMTPAMAEPPAGGVSPAPTVQPPATATQQFFTVQIPFDTAHVIRLLRQAADLLEQMERGG